MRNIEVPSSNLQGASSNLQGAGGQEETVGGCRPTTAPQQSLHRSPTHPHYKEAEYHQTRLTLRYDGPGEDQDTDLVGGYLLNIYFIYSIYKNIYNIYTDRWRWCSSPGEPTPCPYSGASWPWEVRI